MAVNKNALLRYKVLDRCFSNTGRAYTIDNLLEEVNKALREENSDSDGIEIRQLRDDIRFMRSEEGYAIELLEGFKSGRKKCYRYTDPHFSINNNPLNESEIKQLKSALQVLTRIGGLPQSGWVDELVTKLRDKLKLNEADSRQDKVVAFQENEFLTGLQHLTTIYNAIINRRVLDVRFKDFNKEEPREEYRFIFHPYYLKQYNNRWFAFGLNAENDIDKWNVALDRIIDLKESPEHTYVPPKTDWEEHFSNIIGVTTFEKNSLTKVRLRVSPGSAPYIITKPLHESQKPRIDPFSYSNPEQEWLELEIEVIPNYELETQILAYGENIEVISPEPIRKRIAERARQMAGLYDRG